MSPKNQRFAICTAIVLLIALIVSASSHMLSLFVLSAGLMEFGVVMERINDVPARH